MQVMDIKGHVLVNNEDKSKGKFAFTTDDYEVFEICAISKVPPSKPIFIYFFLKFLTVYLYFYSILI